MTQAKSHLLVLTETELSPYQSAMFGDVFAFATNIIGAWDTVTFDIVTKRVSTIVQEYGATEVLLMGRRLASIIRNVTSLSIQRLEGPMLYGILAEHEGIRWIATPAITDYTVGPEASWQAASLLGMLYRHLELLKIGLIGWDNPAEPTTYRLIKTMDDWDECRTLLERAKVVAIDTETRNLQRIGNTMLTIQLGFDGREGWVLPIAHPETPWAPADLKHILGFLKHYFESGRPSIQVFANAVFDLHQIIDLLQIKWYNHKAWDVMAAGYNLEENSMLRPVIGFDRKGIWSLDRLCIEGGMDHFEHTKLGKADRAQLSTKRLEDVAEYAAVDVVLPIRLMRMQRALAAWRNDRMTGRPYERYFKTVTEVENAKLQQFCIMERSGLKVDIDYVLSLRGTNSVFLKQIQESEETFMNLPAVQEANKRLQNNRNVRQGSLFGGSEESTARLFNTGKKEHLALLFFDILKLEPITLNTDGTGSTSKEFKIAYKDVPEVAAFADLLQAKTLYATFIAGYYKILRGSADNRDGRMHSSFGYLFVKSNRASSVNPNLQNIPEHQERAKLIKRQFVASEGKVYFLRDYSAHETRLLGIAARDPVMAQSFWDGMKIRLMYAYQHAIPKEQKEEWKAKLWTADAHVQNYGRLYSVDPSTVTKAQRKIVKGTVFGVTYGMSMGSLAVTIGDTEEAANEVYKKIFKDTFKASGDWIDNTKKIGRTRVAVNNILGGVRHLWGYLHPERRVKGAMDRRGPNSSLQGTASNLGFLGAMFTRKLVWELFESRGIEIGYLQCNAVHDSSYAEVNPLNLPLLGYLSEHGFTTCVHHWMRDTMNFESLIGFEMDAKCGASLSEMHEATRWDDQVAAIEKALKWGNANLGWHQPIDDIMAIVESNARIIHKIRRREIAHQLRNEERVLYTMEMTAANCMNYGLQFTLPSKLKPTKTGWQRELER